MVDTPNVQIVKFIINTSKVLLNLKMSILNTLKRFKFIKGNKSLNKIIILDSGNILE